MDVIRRSLPYTRDFTRVTVISDAHLGCRASDVKGLKALLRERAKLKNSRFLLLGDTGDWIMPKDQKRFALPNLVDELAGSKNLIRQTIDYICDVFHPYRDRLDISLTGNHENSVTKNADCDVAAELASALGVPHGGMSCFMVYRWERNGDPSNSIGNATWLLHHGAWAGQASGDIPPGAYRWASMFEDWDVFCFGHNHSLGASVRSPLRVPRSGDWAVSRPQHIVACGTWRRNYMGPGGGVGYEELKGHRPTTIGAPLIELRPHMGGGGGNDHGKYRRSLERGVPASRVEVRVTI